MYYASAAAANGARDSKVKLNELFPSPLLHCTLQHLLPTFPIIVRNIKKMQFICATGHGYGPFRVSTHCGASICDFFLLFIVLSFFVLVLLLCLYLRFHVFFCCYSFPFPTLTVRVLII